MPLDENDRETRDLVRRLAMRRAARMLTPDEIRNLREDAKRSVAFLRALFSKMQRPNLDEVPPGGAEQATRQSRRSVIPQWVVDEAWRRAWAVEVSGKIPTSDGSLEKVAGVELRRFSLEAVRLRARQIARGMMDMMHPPRVPEDKAK